MKGAKKSDIQYRSLCRKGEKSGTAIDNYNRVEQRQLIRSASDWITMRALRNK